MNFCCSIHLCLFLPVSEQCGDLLFIHFKHYLFSCHFLEWLAHHYILLVKVEASYVINEPWGSSGSTSCVLYQPEPHTSSQMVLINVHMCHLATARDSVHSLSCEISTITFVQPCWWKFSSMTLTRSVELTVWKRVLYLSSVMNNRPAGCCKNKATTGALIGDYPCNKTD